MIKQPNGLYALYNGDVNGRYGNCEINIDKEKYIDNEIAKRKASLEEAFNNADMSNFNGLYQYLVNNKGIEKAKEMIYEMGFDFEQVKRNTVLTVKSDGSSQRDCCSYGKCPICGCSVDSWQSECPKCKQKIKFD